MDAGKLRLIFEHKFLPQNPCLDQELLLDFPGEVEAHLQKFPVDSEFEKNGKVSSCLRTLGNEAFKKHDDISAIRAYTLASVFAPVNSEEMSLAFANRSAVFADLQKWELALGDILLCFATESYPERLHGKLHERKKKCEELLLSPGIPQDYSKTQEDCKVFCEETVYNVKNPIEFVKIDSDPDVGRKLLVTRAIPPGSSVLCEAPFASVLMKQLLFDLEHCHVCLKQIQNGIPCDSCVFSVFCCEQCKTVANAGPHAILCKCFGPLHSIGATEHELLALFVIGVAGRRIIHGFFISGELQPNSSYGQIYNLISHEVSPDLEIQKTKRAQILTRILYDFSNHFFEKSDPPAFFHFVCGLIRSHLSSLPYNAHALKEFPLDKLQTPGRCSSVESIPYATGIFALSSLINHSCNPNVVHIKNGIFGLSSFIAVKTLLPGDEIVVSYSQLYSLQKYECRQEYLRQNYLFDCKCIACNNKWPINQELESLPTKFQCATCQNASVHTSSNGTCQTKTCKTKHNLQLLNAKVTLAETNLCRSYILLNQGNILKCIAMIAPAMQIFNDIISPPFHSSQIAQDLYKRAVELAVHVSLYGTVHNAMN